MWYTTTHFPGNLLSRFSGERKWPLERGERESGVLLSDSWGVKDDVAQTLSMSSVHLWPHQAPTDFEKLLPSLPSYMWHKEAVSCWLTKARVIKVNSAKTADVGPHPGKPCVWLTHCHGWSRRAGVCCSGTLLSLYEEGRSDWHDPLCNTPASVSSCALLILPHLDLTCDLIFSIFYLTIRTGQVLGLGSRVQLLGSSCVSPFTDPTQLSLLHDLRLSSLFPEK